MSGKVDASLRQRLMRGPLADSDGRAAHRAVELRLDGVPDDPLPVTLFIDGQLRKSWSSPPYLFDWATHVETFGTHPAAAHRVKAMAGGASAEIELYVVAAAAGDCNQDGKVDDADVEAVSAEITDGDGADPEATPGGTHAGNPGCDANQDNVDDIVVGPGPVQKSYLEIYSGKNASLLRSTTVFDPSFLGGIFVG